MTPPQQTDAALRKAAARRMVAILLLFALLLAGAVALFLREEHRRSLLLSPQPEPALPEAPAEPTAPPAPAPIPADVRPPAPAVLEDALRQEQALTALREASDYLRARRPDLAETRLRDALAINPDMAPALRLLGLVCLQDGRLADAIAHYEKSLKIEPLHPEALSNLAFAYFQAKNINVALELIDTCRRLHPDYEPALVQEGLIKLAVEPETAIEALRAAAGAAPSDSAPRNNLAVALARTGDYAAARAELQSVLESHPGNFTALFNMAALYAKETNAPAAIPWLRDAMKQVPPSDFRTYLSDPDFDPIRFSPDFQSFLQSLDPSLPPPPVPSAPAP
ncbi:MAG: tetratricopeptide repeat protein [Kiritimatiellae bacterium]|nr:tetratricopeptide repeat protein [Kiritimatiellia bacterium]